MGRSNTILKIYTKNIIGWVTKKAKIAEIYYTHAAKPYQKLWNTSFQKKKQNFIMTQT